MVNGDGEEAWYSCAADRRTGGPFTFEQSRARS
jgi:hypothetical protein